MSTIRRDPVCHMEIEEELAVARRRRNTETFFFCSDGCARLFDAAPERFVRSTASGGPSFQLVIVGGGPAGLTAAVYASIQRLRTLLIANRIGGQAVDSTEMQNYMGFQMIEGRDLATRFRDQLLQSHFIEHRLDDATSLERADGLFHLRTGRGVRFTGEAVIVATGMKHRMLGVPGEDRLLHRGVSFSVVQDAERFHGRDVAVVGGGNSGLQAVSRLAGIARRLYLIAVGGLTGDADDIARARSITNLTILEHTLLREICGQDHVEGIRVASDRGEENFIEVAGVFVEIGFAPDSGLVAGLADLNERGEIVIAPDCSTKVPGLFAAGDVSSSYGKRVIIACGEGAKAALAAQRHLLRPQQQRLAFAARGAEGRVR